MKVYEQLVEEIIADERNDGQARLGRPPIGAAGDKERKERL